MSTFKMAQVTRRRSYNTIGDNNGYENLNGGKSSSGYRIAIGIAITALVIAIVLGLTSIIWIGVHTTKGQALPTLPMCHNSRVSGETMLSEQWECLRLPFDYTTSTRADRRNPPDEARLAINPVNPQNIMTTSHQGIFRGWNSNVVWYSMDGGITWSVAKLPQTRCMGVTVNGAEDDYFTASDPDVAFAKDGTAYAVSVSFNLGTETTPNALQFAEGVVA